MNHISRGDKKNCKSKNMEVNLTAETTVFASHVLFLSTPIAFLQSQQNETPALNPQEGHKTLSSP